MWPCCSYYWLIGCSTTSSSEVTTLIQIQDCSLMLRPMIFLKTAMNDFVNNSLQRFWCCKCNAHIFWVRVAVIYHHMNVLPYDVWCCLHNLQFIVLPISPIYCTAYHKGSHNLCTIYCTAYQFIVLPISPIYCTAYHKGSHNCTHGMWTWFSMHIYFGVSVFIV